jgi:hypothetical protein
MRKRLLLAVLLAPLASMASATTLNFVQAGDIGSMTPNLYSGFLGVRFGVEASEIPAGQWVEVTSLGFYAGVAGQFPGAGAVDASQVISLGGPQPWGTRAGDYSSLIVATATVPAGNPVDAQGWSWVSLPSPVTLAAGQYYVVGASLQSGNSSDPYFDPYNGLNPTISAPGTIFKNGSGDTYMKGRYGLGAGAEAYDASGYLVANFQYQVIPEPATAAAAFGALALLLALWRRQRSR